MIAARLTDDDNCNHYEGIVGGRGSPERKHVTSLATRRPETAPTHKNFRGVGESSVINFVTVESNIEVVSSWHNFEGESDDGENFDDDSDIAWFGACASIKFDDEFALDEENTAFAFDEVDGSEFGDSYSHEVTGNLSPDGEKTADDDSSSPSSSSPPVITRSRSSKTELGECTEEPRRVRIVSAAARRNLTSRPLSR